VSSIKQGREDCEQPGANIHGRASAARFPVKLPVAVKSGAKSVRRNAEHFRNGVLFEVDAICSGIAWTLRSRCRRCGAARKMFESIAEGEWCEVLRMVAGAGWRRHRRVRFERR